MGSEMCIRDRLGTSTEQASTRLDTVEFPRPSSCSVPDLTYDIVAFNDNDRSRRVLSDQQLHRINSSSHCYDPESDLRKRPCPPDGPDHGTPYNFELSRGSLRYPEVHGNRTSLPDKTTVHEKDLLFGETGSGPCGKRFVDDHRSSSEPLQQTAVYSNDVERNPVSAMDFSHEQNCPVSIPGICDDGMRSSSESRSGCPGTRSEGQSLSEDFSRADSFFEPDTYRRKSGSGGGSVSYTHLTLPTILRV